MKMRMQQFTRILMIAFALKAASVSGENEKPVPPAGFTKLVLGSSGGFTGRGEGKSLKVEADGAIEVKEQGKQTQGKLKPDELENLRKLAAAVNWAEIHPAYRAGADMFMSDLAVTIGGKVNTTSVSNPRPPNVPKSLAALLDYLRELRKGYKP